MIEDFNEVLLPSEIKEGIFTVRQALKFSIMMEQCNLINLHVVAILRLVRREGL